MKDANSHLPVTPDEIIADAIAVCKAGASIVHIHARDIHGKPSWNPDIYTKIFDGIRSECDIIICASTSGRVFRNMFQRRAVLEAGPDMASLTLGSPMFILNDSVGVNKHSDIVELLKEMKDCSVKPELEVFEPGMIHYSTYLMDEGILDRDRPYYSLMLGSLGNMPGHPDDIKMMVGYIPPDSIISAAGIGKYHNGVAMAATIFGHHVRIGLEDSLYMDHISMTPATNVKQVESVVWYANSIGRPIATPKEARDMLGL